MENQCPDLNKKDLRNLMNFKNLVNKEDRNYLKNHHINKNKVCGLLYMKYGMNNEGTCII